MRTEQVRLARASAHPDRNDGDRAAWDAVERAAMSLGLGQNLHGGRA